MRAPLGLLSALLLAPACASEPRVTPIVGPDGSPMLHVSCGGAEASCFELAGRRCPQGYEMARTQGDSGNYLVRCRGQVGSGTWAPRGSGASWAPTVELAPSPYATPMGPAPYRAPVPMTTVPPGYPPLGPSPGGPDLGY